MIFSYAALREVANIGFLKNDEICRVSLSCKHLDITTREPHRKRRRNSSRRERREFQRNLMLVTEDLMQEDINSEVCVLQ